MAKIEPVLGVRFTVKGRPPNLANSRLHHMAAYKMKRAYRDLTWVEAVKARGGRPKATEKRRATAVVRLAGTPMDHDNLSHALKAAWDALVLAGLLVDDSPEWLHPNVFQARVAHKVDEGVDWTVEC